MQDNLELLRCVKNGDIAARDSLVTGNMALVTSVAKRYLGRGQELEDLIQIGVIGLIKSIDRFDFSYNVRFSTFAVPYIQGEIRRFLRDDGMIKVSRSLKTTYYQARCYQEEQEKKYGHTPTMNEICKHIGVSQEDLVMAMEVSETHVNIDEIHKEKAGQDETGGIIEKIYIQQLMEALTQEESQIIKLRYFENKTQQQVGEILNISQVKVSRMEKKLLGKLRQKAEVAK